MVVESLFYVQNSLLAGPNVLLEPEIKHSPTFFNAELVDPALIIESFYRLFRVIKIRTGRQALSETRRLWNYDPIITVDDEGLQFETFSNDVTHYACLMLEKTAFKNVKEWQAGQTNVDFTPTFIEKLRAAGPKVVRSLEVDPKGFSVHADQEKLTEKKVDMPANWRIALDNIRTFVDPNDSVSKLEKPDQFVQGTPFGPYVKKYATLDVGWVPREGWKFALMQLRNNLGTIIMGATDTPTARFDGRQNPKYAAIRDMGTLRALKSYLLKVGQLHGTVWEVEGGGRKHIVQKQGTIVTCDCPDFRYGRKTCKHVRAVFKPQVRLDKLGEDEWRIITRDNAGIDKHTVSFKDQKFTCTCKEYNNTNICFHIVEVLQVEKDFQFNELLQDLT